MQVGGHGGRLVLLAHPISTGRVGKSLDMFPPAVRPAYDKSTAGSCCLYYYYFDTVNPLYSDRLVKSGLHIAILCEYCGLDTTVTKPGCAQTEKGGNPLNSAVTRKRGKTTKLKGTNHREN